MAYRTDRRAGDSRYYLRFGLTAFLLISGTLVLVLYVFPKRYVLSAGQADSGISFPTPSTPFVPVEVVQMAALLLPTRPPDILPGPAELFWDEVIPHLESQRYSQAIPLFERYLVDRPADRDVRREYAITLLSAGRAEEAVEVLGRMLETEDDPDRRLLLARTLRDLGRVDEASTHYAVLVEGRPQDPALALEWAQALAWAEDYEGAASVLTAGLSRLPDSVPLRVELARVFYAFGRLEDASAILADIDDPTLESAGALTLKTDIMAALAVPEVPEEEPPPPSLLEQAVGARVDGDFVRATALFEEAIRDSPESVETWQAYADLLQYELDDLEGARDALLQVERLGEPDFDLQYRLAQLEIWAEQYADARVRLLALLDDLERGGAGLGAREETGPTEIPPVTRADVQAALGDLDRWDGKRISAARRYQLALDTDAANLRALDGLEALRAEVARMLIEVEEPRVGGSAYSLADTDEFSRVDLAGEWVGVQGDWVWGGRTGNRWLEGLDLTGVAADRQGLYAELESARWWRWATVRTELRFGAQKVRASWDYSLGASVRHRGGGTATELRYDHGPAYPLTGTLQSVLAGVSQDRFTLSHTRPLDDRWNLSAIGDAAWLRPSGAEMDEGTVRLQAAMSVGRSMTETFTLGLSARALGYTRAAPVVTPTPPIPSALPLFWDPRAVVSAGPYAQLNRELSALWTVTGRIEPGFALIDERRSDGSQLIPHLSAEAGLRHRGARFWTTLGIFYYQGQFDGYRTYGIRLSFSARDLSTLEAGG